jgi:hypothetical protein
MESAAAATAAVTIRMTVPPAGGRIHVWPRA